MRVPVGFQASVRILYHDVKPVSPCPSVCRNLRDSRGTRTCANQARAQRDLGSFVSLDCRIHSRSDLCV